MYWLIKTDELVREACAYMSDVGSGKITRTLVDDKKFQNNLRTAVTLLAFVRTSTFKITDDIERHKTNEKT